MKIEINEFGQIRCCPDDSTVLYCDTLQLLTQGAECGGCPILRICEQYEKDLYGEIDNGHVDLTKKTK